MCNTNICRLAFEFVKSAGDLERKAVLDGADGAAYPFLGAAVPAAYAALGAGAVGAGSGAVVQLLRKALATEERKKDISVADGALIGGGAAGTLGALGGGGFGLHAIAQLIAQQKTVDAYRGALKLPRQAIVR